MQQFQRVRSRVEAVLIRRRVPAQIETKAWWWLIMRFVGDNQTFLKPRAEQHSRGTRHRQAGLANGDDEDMFDAPQIATRIADTKLLVFQPQVR